MPKQLLESLGALVREKRGARKLRETAKEIGIGPATLMRVESGRTPDLNTFRLLCNWLGIDPRDFLGFTEEKQEETAQAAIFSVHFRADRMSEQQTIQCIAQMVALAAKRQPRLQPQVNG